VRCTIAAVTLAAALVAAGCGNKSASGAGGCEKVKRPAPRSVKASPPPGVLYPSKTYSLRFETSCGTFVVRLDLKSAPATTASLVKLTSHGFYDNTIFHRIVPDFVIQGGDPTQTGAGGPGYSTDDAPPSDARYTKGVVAMAKTPSQRSGTAGSQFFVVTAGDAGLSPDYAIVGKIVSGMDVVDRIGKFGSTSGRPTKTVVIRKARVVVS
jgi:peptidyl-prolyl cis-trans isomerase B (cyclophilin B)